MPFKFDGTISRILGNIGIFIVVNLLCIFFCLPIVTAGASVTALHYVMLKFVRQESPNMVSDFWKSFKTNLRQGIAIHLISIAAALLLYANMRFLTAQFHTGIVFQILTILCGVIVFLYLLTMTVIYPLLAGYSNTVARTFYNAFLLAIANLPVSFLLLLLNLIPVFLFLLWPGGFLGAIPVYVFVGFSLVSFIDCSLLNRIFQKLTA